MRDRHANPFVSDRPSRRSKGRSLLLLFVAMFLALLLWKHALWGALGWATTATLAMGILGKVKSKGTKVAVLLALVGVFAFWMMRTQHRVVSRAGARAFHGSSAASGPGGAQRVTQCTADPIYCSPTDRDFDTYYPLGRLRIPHCRRNVDPNLKRALKRRAGIPEWEWAYYEIDHILPLSLGGNNSPANLHPIPKNDHDAKTELENTLKRELATGAIDYCEAVDELLNWRPR